jgi:hypothetical protein|tara:strand:+ start:137 stop:577 length:441 start_codon:yes stop_codon:yes gene_type:complete
MYLVARSMLYAREEARLHRACVKVLRERCPGAVTYRHSGGQRLAGGARHFRLAKLEGTTKGAPDLVMLKRGADGTSGLCVEFKAPGSEKRVTAEQRASLSALAAEGFSTHVLSSVTQFKQVLDVHLGASLNVVYDSNLGVEVIVVD